jgi:hypothetical protein
MHTKQLKVAIVLALALLLVVALSAFAAPDAPEHFSVRLRNATVPWVYPPPEGINNAVCSQVPVGLSINPDDNGSDRRKNATVFTRADGTKRVLIRDVVTGTATDNLGNTYRFIYRNNVNARFDGSAVHMKMTDFFSLRGLDNRDANFNLRFVWLWAYEADSFELVEVQDASGETINLEMSPFFFPTDDGVTESPNIIPGSWRVPLSEGEIFCDPL